MYQISGIGVTRGWESLRNEVPGTENPKVPKTKVSKKKKKPKSAESNESSENLFESKYLSFLFVLAYKCYELFRKE
jgi:ATP/ADP translocase